MDNENIENIKRMLMAINDSTPDYIKQSFFKALDRIGSAIVDVPTAWIERYSEKYRTTTEVQKQGILATGDSINRKIETPQEYSDYAMKRNLKRILGRQFNIDAVSIIATEAINASSDFTTVDEYQPISDDWINEFTDIAGRKSSEDMRLIFGKILAKEVCQPGSVSIRSLHIVSQLEPDIAASFQKFCKFCIKHINNGKIITAFAPTFGSAIINNYSFSKYDFRDFDITKLMEYGLINYATEFSYNFSPCINNGTEDFESYTWFGDRNIILLKTENYKEKEKIAINGIFLSDVGVSLLSIITTDVDIRILERLESYFEGKGLMLQ